MSYVIDTHIFLWLVFNPDKLSKQIVNVLKDPTNKVYVTSITFWEISLKYNLGKLDLQGVSPDKLPATAEQMDIDIIDIDTVAMASFYKLPKNTQHKDPFDRIIIWFCIQHQFTLVSEDSKFFGYAQNGLKVLKS